MNDMKKQTVIELVDVDGDNVPDEVRLSIPIARLGVCFGSLLAAIVAAIEFL